MILRDFIRSDQQAVIALWEVCELTRPWNSPETDIERLLSVHDAGMLVAENDAGTLIGGVMYGYDGHRGAVYYLAVHPNHQKTGLGRKLMEEVERILTDMGCPKINLMVRDTNLAVAQFYEAIGYARQDVAVFGKRLIPDP